MARRKTPKTKTLVRGPDGALWLLSEHEAPIKLGSEQKEKVERIIDDCEDRLSSEEIVAGIRACVGVHVGVSTVVVQHGRRSGEGRKP
jgi:hypothetical protein